MSAQPKLDGTPLLLRQDRDGIAHLTLNRPEQRNALSRALMAELTAALACIAADRALRAVVLQDSGPAFCAGHDLRELAANREPAFYEAVFAECSRLMLAIPRLPQPV